MELIRGLHNVQPRHRPCAATIGNFDGIHLGHQAVLGQLSDRAAAMRLPALVITFEPQPREFFAPDRAPARITRLREKLLALHRYSVDRVLCLRFDEALARRKPWEFVRDVLVEGLGVKYLVVGDDFRFGMGRDGDFNYLKSEGDRFGMQVVNMHTFNVEGARVSSTRVRDALEQGDLALAEQLLGRSYRMCGRVAHGDKRGRTIGFPTANIHLHRAKTPLTGVYEVELFGLDKEPVKGVANIGTRPTVDGQRTLLEVHLFDFNEDIYGEYVQVEFLNKIRDEVRFDSFDELRQQIERDVQEARAYFAAG